MIRDADALQSIRESWRTVRILQARIDTTLSPDIYSLLPVATRFREVPESLLLVFAMATLDDVLSQLRAEGNFKSGRPELGALMEASRSGLPWHDFDAVDRARKRRNDVAHRREFLVEGECAQFLNAIESELLKWGILDRPIKGQYSISFTPSKG